MKAKKHFGIYLILAIIFAPVFTACLNGHHGNEASIILNLGGNSGNRTVWPHENDRGILDKIVYKIVIDGQEYRELESTGGKIIKTTVTPGIYAIKVEAFYSERPYAKYSGENIKIKAGQNTVQVILENVWDEGTGDYENPDKNIYLIVGEERKPFSTLAAALLFGKDNEDLIEFTVSIYDGWHYIYSDLGGKIDNNKTVTIENRGNGTANIFLGVLDPEEDFELNGSMFSVSGNLTLQGDITLRGIENNGAALIAVEIDGIFNMGRLSMGDNVVITGNKNINDGGGVSVSYNGIFNMYSGTITGNTAADGGGVYVYGKNGSFNGGTFNMNGGTIIGNTATNNGGGVYVGKESHVSFYNEEKITGNIVNNSAPNNNNNICKEND